MALISLLVTLLMETGCFTTILGIFPCEVKDIIFAWRGAHEVRLKRTLETEGGGRGEIEKNTRKLGNSKEWREVLDLHKTGNELSLDLHKSSNEFI